MSDRIKQFEEYLTGGYPLEKWHFTYENGAQGRERIAVLFFMDAEYDPFRATFDWEGGIQIHADENKYVSLTSDRLEWLADKLREVRALVEAWQNGSRNRVRKAWGKPEED